jgi:hypothetical protein
MVWLGRWEPVAGRAAAFFGAGADAAGFRREPLETVAAAAASF